MLQQLLTQRKITLDIQSFTYMTKIRHGQEQSFEQIFRHRQFILLYFHLRLFLQHPETPNTIIPLISPSGCYKTRNELFYLILHSTQKLIEKQQTTYPGAILNYKKTLLKLQIIWKKYLLTTLQLVLHIHVILRFARMWKLSDVFLIFTQNVLLLLHTLFI